jgi:uridine kinase
MDTTPPKIKGEDFNFLTPVSGSYSLAEPLVKKISDATPSQIIVIGIAGGSGSGKTTLAKAIYETIGEENITFISHDSYYRDLRHLTVEQRAQQNFDHPDSLDTALLTAHVLALKNGSSVSVPSYDYTTHSRIEATTFAAPRPVVLIEGILIFSDKDLYDLMDIKIFVDTDDDIRLIRRIQRDTVERGRSLNGIINQYMSTVRPMHMQFVEPSKRNADIIVPVGLNSVALDLVVSKLKSHLMEN